jgi:hypothetical protein
MSTLTWLNGDQMVRRLRESDLCCDYSRAPYAGSLITPATWIRNFVRSHPAYRFDSVVSQEINYDLFVAMDEM